MRPSLPIFLCLSATLSLGAGAAGLAQTARPSAKPTAAKPGVPAWVADKANSKINFKSAYSGMPLEGAFSRWDAQINFDAKNLSASKVVVSVDLASAMSGDQDRDETLPTADWFDVSKFPRAVFTTTTIKDLGGGRYQAVGTLSLKGVVRPVTLPFTLSISGDTARMSGQAVLNRSQFGVGQGQFAGPEAVPLEVTVPISLVAKRAN